MSDERHSEAAPRETSPQQAPPEERVAPAGGASERNPSLGEAISDEDAAGGSAGGARDDARYASQASVAEPAPVALEGGASVPGGGGSAGGGTTGRREWVFLMLAVLFSLALVAVPALLFTSIDLTGAAEEAAGGNAAAGEAERLQLLQETRTDALSKLYTYGPSEDTGGFRIPLERAMRLTLEQDYPAAAALGQGGTPGAAQLKLAIPGGAQRSSAPAAAPDSAAAAQR